MKRMQKIALWLAMPLISFVAVILGPVPASADITVLPVTLADSNRSNDDIITDNATYIGDTYDDNSYKYYLTVPSGTELLVIGQTNTRARQSQQVTLTGGALSGASLTLAGGHNNDNDERTALWYYVNPPAGTYEAYCKFSNSTRSKASGVWCISGVNTDAPIIAVKEYGIAIPGNVTFSSSEVAPGCVIFSIVTSKDNNGGSYMTGMGSPTRSYEKYRDRDGSNTEDDFTTAGGYVTGVGSGGNTGWDGLSKNLSMAAFSVRADLPPSDITSNPSSLAVGDSRPNDYVIGVLTAVDPFYGASDTFTWSEVSGGSTDTAAFKLVSTGAPNQIAIAVEDTSRINRATYASMNYRVRVTNQGGLSYEETFAIAITDTTVPTLDLSPATIYVGSNCLAAVPNFSGRASDNVGVTSFTQSIPANSTRTVGAYSVTLTAADAAGNNRNDSMTLIVADNTPPAQSGAPASVTIYLPASDSGSCNLNMPDFAVDLSMAGFFSDCTALTYTQSPAAGSLWNSGAGSVSAWIKATDAGGLATTHAFTLAVVDNSAPYIAWNDNESLTLNMNASGQVTIPSFAGATSVNGHAIIDCSSYAITQNRAGAYTYSLGPHPNEIVLTITDVSGNATAINLDLIVADVTPPVINWGGGNQTISSGDASCQALLPDYTGSAFLTVYDNSGITPAVTQNPVPGTAVVPGNSVTVTLTAADSVSLTASVNFLAAAVDGGKPALANTAPSVSCECPNSYGLAEAKSGVTAYDACDGNITANISVNVLREGLPATFPLQGIGLYTITYSVSDTAGNAATPATRVLTIADTIPPAITVCAGDQTLNTDAAACTASIPDYTGLVTAEDACDATVSLTQAPAPGLNLEAGAHSAMITAEDDAGHTTSCYFTVTVSDHEKPVIINTVPSENLTCGSGFSYSLSDAAQNIAVDDNCTDLDSGDLVITVTGDASGFPLEGTGNYLIHYNVKDAALNAANEVTRTLTVTDSVPPVITDATPSAVTLEYPASYAVSAARNGLSAMDACTGDLTASVMITASLGGTPVAFDLTHPLRALGVYTIHYNVNDTSGNAAVTKTRSVTIADTTGPEITLYGEEYVLVECGDSYEESDALAANAVSAHDAYSGDCAVTVLATRAGGGVASFPLTDRVVYTLTYTAVDGTGHTTFNTDRTVTIADETPPIIKLNGNSGATPVFVPFHGVWNEPGGSVEEACGTLVWGDVIIGGASVNTDALGSYVITYNVSDAAGNAAVEKQRTVIVTDQIPPEITVIGGDTAAECGSDYEDAGATAEDRDGADLTSAVQVSGLEGVDTASPGNYQVNYQVTDGYGVTGYAQRVVTVMDTKAPSIVLLGLDGNPGGEEVTIPVGVKPWAEWEPGFVVSDTCDTALSNDDVLVTSSDEKAAPNTFEVGYYALYYSVEDAAGNETSVARIVHVVEDGPPVIAVDEETAVSEVDCGDSLGESGALLGITAEDDVDGDISANIIVAGAILDMPLAPGEYVISYNVSDGAGNWAEPVSRTITVPDNCPLHVTYVGEHGNPQGGTVRVNAGIDYTFAVAVTGNIGECSYQWMRYDEATGDWHTIPNADQAAYTLSSVDESDSARYQCEVSDDMTTRTISVTLHVGGTAVPVAGALGMMILLSALGGATLPACRRKQ